jgi:type IV secretory pathway VirB4 component
VDNKDFIAPAYVDNQNPRYFEVDNMYYIGLIVTDYYREYSDIIFKNLINTNINMNITCFYEKQDSYKTIKDLTYYIGNVGVDLKEGNSNREDIEIAAYSYNDAKFIRKEMQVNNEDLYYIYTYVSVYSEDKKEVEFLANKVEGILQSNGLTTRRGNFRQEPIFISCSPTMINSKEIKEAGKRNILSNSLVSTYPFISSNICDEEGIFIGSNIYNNSMILVDRFNKDKYKNANMCVFGTSGAGKSFYIKSLILRYRLLGVSQFIIDPEREYNNLCQNLNGSLIKLRSNVR